MKSEPDLPLTIARLVRDAAPVTPLAAPAARLARWTIASTCLVVASVIVLGVRIDAAVQVGDGWFVARGAATLSVALAAAGVAFFMSVPGGEPSRLVRALPLAAGLFWAALLLGTIAAAASPLDLVRRVAPHPACVLFITATALLPGVLLVRMLRRAAPLQARWTAGFAGLASLAAGALGTQFVCANDAAAHHLLWHFTPVVLLALASVAPGSFWLRWPYRQSL